MIDVSVSEDSGTGSGIVAWTEAIEDPRPALQSIGEIMRASVQDRWDSETDPWGASWQPRSITTIEIREKQGKDPFPSAFTAASRIVDDGKTARVGFGSPMPRYIHEGNPSNRVFGRGRGPRPARPVLPLRGGGVDLPDGLRDEIMAAFRREVLAVVQRGSGER